MIKSKKMPPIRAAKHHVDEQPKQDQPSPVLFFGAKFLRSSATLQAICRQVLKPRTRITGLAMISSVAEAIAFRLSSRPASIAVLAAGDLLTREHGRPDERG
jgi:hypothetical protein